MNGHGRPAHIMMAVVAKVANETEGMSSGRHIIE